MNKLYDKEQILELLKKSEYLSCEIEEYKVGESRNSYFDKEENIYDRFSEDIDNLEFLGDKVQLIRSDYSYNSNSTLSEIFDAISGYELDEIDGYQDIQNEIDSYNESLEEDEEKEEPLANLDDMTLGEVETKYENFYGQIIDILDELTEDNLDILNGGEYIFDCPYIEEKIDAGTYDALAYWTVYFKPDYEDEEVARQVGLVPFKFDDTFYLALGGCGMDLSPKLDAYVALTYGLIPRDSHFFNDSDYFKYVVGEAVYNKIVSKCKRSNPQYTISFTLKTEEE